MMITNYNVIIVSHQNVQKPTCVPPMLCCKSLSVILYLPVNTSFTVLQGCNRVMYFGPSQLNDVTQAHPSKILHIHHRSYLSQMCTLWSCFPLASDQKGDKTLHQPTLDRHANPAAAGVCRKSTVNSPAHQSQLDHMMHHALVKIKLLVMGNINCSLIKQTFISILTIMATACAFSVSCTVDFLTLN